MTRMFNVRKEKIENLSIVKLKKPKNPLFISVVPHSGYGIPLEMTKYIDITKPNLKTCDDYTDEIYDLTDIGGIFLSTDVSRFAIDFNRKRHERGKEGLIRSVDIDGNPILKKMVPEKDRKYLTKKYYNPFYEAMNKNVQDLKKKQGFAFLLNGHSMKSYIPKPRQKIESGTRPDFCIGTNSDTTASKRMLLAFEKALKKHTKKYGFSVKRDYPFKGEKGINAIYASPEKGLNSILLEINKKTYLDRQGNKKPKEFKIVKGIIKATMRDFCKNVFKESKET